MIINQNVPICPKCKAGLSRAVQDKDVYYFCLDCMSIYKVIGTGKAENELIITDRYEKPNKENACKDS